MQNAVMTRAAPWVRAELRQRWRSLVALALLWALVVAAVLAALAGARRTSTSFERFLGEARASHAQVQLSQGLDGRSDVDLGGGATADQVIREISGTPAVEAVGTGAVLHLAPPSMEPGADFVAYASLDEKAWPVDRPRMVRGRLPSAADEIALNELAASELGKDPGDRLVLQARGPEQMQRLIFLGDVSVTKEPADGARVDAVVTGVVRGPADIGGSNLAGPYAVVSKALYDRYSPAMSQFAPMAWVRMKRGYKDLDVVQQVIARIAPESQEISIQDKRVDTDAVDGALDVQALALLVFAGVAAAAGIAIVATAAARQVAGSAKDIPVLGALGTTRRQRTVALAGSVVPAVVIGSTLGLLGAFAASPLLPLGIGRAAEPEPGIAFDALVLPLGVLALTLVLITPVAVVCWRASGLAPSVDRMVALSRPTSVARMISGAGLRAVTSTGLRLAFDRGPRGSATATRSAIAGTTFAIAGIAAVLTFGASLTDTVSRPALSGFPWHAEIGGGESEDSIREGTDAAVADDEIDTVMVARIAGTTIGGKHTQVYGTRMAKGTAGLTVLGGKGPTAPDEVALGPKTADRLGRRTGDRVRLAAGDGALRTYRVVGTAIFPIIDNADYAEGAWFTLDGLEYLKPSEGFHNVLARFAEGVDVDAKRAELEEQLGFLFEVEQPAQVANLNHAKEFPRALAAFLAILGVAVVAHALVTSPRRRAREFAVLRSLGMLGRQVRATLSVQALALAVVGIVVGIPVGVAAGRWLWRLVGDRLDVVVRPVVPAAVALVVPATLVIAVALAALPARRAAAVRPAEVLRTE